MACELCGKEGADIRARIEGVTMRVCRSCSAHGEVLPEPTPVHTSRPAPKRAQELEEVDPRVASILRREREKRGLTQEAFAQRLRIRLSTYHHYETGSVLPSVADARSIERSLGIRLIGRARVQDEQPMHAHSASTGMTFGDFLKN